MIRWALTFLAVALVAAIFGFNVSGSGAGQTAQFLFVIFLVLFVVSLTGDRRRAPPL